MRYLWGVKSPRIPASSRLSLFVASLLERRYVPCRASSHNGLTFKNQEEPTLDLPANP